MSALLDDSYWVNLMSTWAGTGSEWRRDLRPSEGRRTNGISLMQELWARSASVRRGRDYFKLRTATGLLSVFKFKLCVALGCEVGIDLRVHGTVESNILLPHILIVLVSTLGQLCRLENPKAGLTRL